MKTTGIMKITDITENITAAYFDLEFCNERISRHNVPVAIGISFRRGGEEIGRYHALIWCGDEHELWREQLEHIGYDKKMLQCNGKSMAEITEELLAAHEEYQPKLYISLGKQDEDLLKKFVTQELEGWHFCDAIKFLPIRLSMKYDISLEKYAYICGITFVHTFDPLADARSLGEVIWCVLQGKVQEKRRQEIAQEYDRKMFLTEYRNKQQAYDYLSELPCLTLKQLEKQNMHRAYLKKYREKYRLYMNETSCHSSVDAQVKTESR